MRQVGSNLNPLRGTTTHIEQFAFRWRSYDSCFCMNKIVCRYCDLRIAKSLRCMYFFRRTTRFRGNASGPLSTAREDYRSSFNRTQVLAYPRAGGGEATPPRQESHFLSARSTPHKLAAKVSNLHPTKCRNNCQLRLADVVSERPSDDRLSVFTGFLAVKP